MDFYEVVDQVVQLLQQRGRLTYRSLKVQFKLDDETCEALKDELLFSHPVVDHDGRGVVWIGAYEAQPARVSASPSAQTSQLPPAEEEPPPQVEPLSTEPRIPEAERRQLTVMFCDLVDSTKLSSQLDPEDYRDVVRAYQQVCSEVITRFAGHIAQLLGDGLLVYFGYPQAHEDDAQRAVRTGLDILNDMGDLNQALQQAKGIQLAVRIGIHTGLVVVGEMGSQGRQEQLALGQVPNVCSRIQGLAAPNTIAMSEATYRLVQGYFQCQDLGVQTLRGVAQPLHVYQVLGESGVHSRLDIASARGLTPLVGREQEVGLLLERWAAVKAGHGHIVLLMGDAGIGKSRLVQVLKDHIANEPHARWECRSAGYSQNTTLFPLTDLFQRLLRFQAEDTLDEKFSKLEQMLNQYRLPLEESVQLFAPLFSLPIPENRYPPLNLSPQRQRQKTLETLVAILLELAERQPVLFILEDLHWTDPTTLEFLGLLVEQVPTAAIYTLLTCRPHFQPAWHHRSYLTEVTVHRLSPAQVEQIVNRMTAGRTLPPEVLQQILAKTDGVPLFVEEMTKAILESGQLKAVNGHYELVGPSSTFTIPATLQDSLMARLDRLVTAKAVAQYAAVIGRQFAYMLLQAVSQLDEATLRRELSRLVGAELVYQRGLPPQATYTFKHALIQDAAYQSLLRSTRQQIHQRTAQVLVEQFPTLVEIQPELLAQHYTEAGLGELAVGYWQRAGERVRRAAGEREAIAHYSKGLDILQTLPVTPARTQQELDMLVNLIEVLGNTKGPAFAASGQLMAQARVLCQQTGDTPHLFWVLFYLRTGYTARGEHQAAREVAEQALALAQRLQEPPLFVSAHYSLGTALMSLGDLTSARSHFEQALAYDDAQQRNFRAWAHTVLSLNHAARILWLLGYPDQALQRNHEAFIVVQQWSNPHHVYLTLVFASVFHQLRREVPAVHERTEAALALAAEQGGTMQFLESLMHRRGWVLAAQGHYEEGIAQMRHSLEAMQARGEMQGRPWQLALLAVAYGQSQQAEEGLRLLAEALAVMDSTGERNYEAELYRIQGELLGQRAVSDAHQAEAWLQQALAVARLQEAKSLELRAAMSLSRLWQQQGKHVEARELLAPIYDWFTEGFDTADLQDATVLLNELGA